MTMVCPPSTGSTAPVMWLAWALARNRIAAAAAVLLDVVDDSGPVVCVAADDEDLRTARRERRSRCPSDTGRPAGDQYALVLELAVG
jgi:hypothetical protein